MLAWLDQIAFDLHYFKVRSTHSRLKTNFIDIYILIFLCYFLLNIIYSILLVWKGVWGLGFGVWGLGFESAKLSRALRNKLWAEACMTAIDIENLIVHARHENPSYREFATILD